MAAQPAQQIRSIRSVIARELQHVATEHGRRLEPLTDEVRLLESGLDSLGLAILVARLEDELGIDPFASGQFVESPVTFGDFVRVYERALQRVA